MRFVLIDFNNVFATQFFGSIYMHEYKNSFSIGVENMNRSWVEKFCCSSVSLFVSEYNARPIELVTDRRTIKLYKAIQIKL